MTSRKPLEQYEVFYIQHELAVVRLLRAVGRNLDLEILALLIALGHGGFAIGMAIKLIV